MPEFLEGLDGSTGWGLAAGGSINFANSLALYFGAAGGGGGGRAAETLERAFSAFLSTAFRDSVVFSESGGVNASAATEGFLDAAGAGASADAVRFTGAGTLMAGGGGTISDGFARTFGGVNRRFGWAAGLAVGLDSEGRLEATPTGAGFAVGARRDAPGGTSLKSVGPPVGTP